MEVILVGCVAERGATYSRVNKYESHEDALAKRLQV